MFDKLLGLLNRKRSRRAAVQRQFVLGRIDGQAMTDEEVVALVKALPAHFANPTTAVASTRVGFDDTQSYWQLTTVNDPYTYVTGQLMGLNALGLADNFDDSQPLRFLGLWTGIQQLFDTTVPAGYFLAKVDRPQFIEMPVVNSAGAATTASRLTDIGKPVFVYNAGAVTLDPSLLTYANQVGWVEDVIGGSGFPLATTGPNIKIRPIPPEFAGCFQVTPTALAGAGGSSNNYNPTGLLDTQYLRVDPGTGGFTLTGLAAGRPWQIITVVNINATSGNSLTLAHESASSTAGNRFHCASLQSVVIGPGDNIPLIYDPILARWLVAGTGRNLTVAVPTQFTSIATGNGTLTAAQVAGAAHTTLITSGATALTTPTAAAILAAIPNGAVGTSYILRIVNTNAGTLTITADASITATGTLTLATATWREWYVTITGTGATATMKQIGTGTTS